MDDTPIRIDRDGHVAVLTMNRPEARNAMNARMTAALDDAYDELGADDDTWAVVLTGAGDRAFCAGQDLSEVPPVLDASSIAAAGGRGGFGGITRREFPKPLLAAINGAALGGGLEIALACDLLVAEEHARLGLPEVTRGLFAGAGGLVRLGRRIPPAFALELVLTGAPVTAARALELGLVNRVVPTGTGVDAAVALAQQICEAAPLAVRMSKRVVRTALAQGEDQLWALQLELAAELLASDDFAEGPRAFLEKRPPRWTGR